MSGKFITIVFTSPEEVAHEGTKISLLIDHGVDFIHLRKPEWPIARLRQLIKSIDSRYHRHLRIHDHFELINEFDLRGVHLNRRNPLAPERVHSVSLSLHTLKEVASLKNPDKFEYVTLSPIFDSISKPGYSSRFSVTELNQLPPRPPIIALGGVIPQKFGFLKERGFQGAGLLGYIWDHSFERALAYLSEEITKINDN